MKNNIAYYRRDANSYNHWKFKMLRQRYGWAGEAKFWALADMIASAEKCKLDISNRSRIMAICAEIEFSPEDLHAFITYISDDLALVINKNGKLTTQVVQEVFKEVDERRVRQRKRKLELKDKDVDGGIEKTVADTQKKSTEKTGKSTEILEKSTESLQRVSEDFEQSKVKESKEKKTKEKEITVNYSKAKENAHETIAKPLPTHELKQGFTEFKQWINTHTPNVAKMHEPFTADQFTVIAGSFKHNAPEIKNLLTAMHKWPALLQQKRSAFNTLLEWKNDGSP